MSGSTEWNFAARLCSRLQDHSDLIDAANGKIIAAADVPNLIAVAASVFLCAGLRAGDRILIGCNLSPPSTLAYLGALYAGLTAVPVSESSLSDSAEAIASKVGARALWTERDIRSEWLRCSGLKHIAGGFAASSTDMQAPAARREEDLAALMPTSGSTGAPRLVRVSHGNLIANTEAIIRSQRLASDERAMLILPISYCFGASVMHTHLYQGGSVVYDARFMFPDKVLRAIEQYACTSFAGVPTAFNILLRRSNVGSIPLPSLRRFLQAGGALASERIQQMRQIVPQAEFFVMYGQTEATARISCLPPHRLDQKLGSVGLPLDNLKIRIVDDQGRDASAGQPGEIWVSGESICNGYFDEPEETAGKFRNGWLLTGDIASRDSDGFLWIVGRKSEFVKMRGIRVSLAEIERRIAASPGVSECAAIVVAHPEAAEAVALYAVAEEGAGDVIAAIRRQLAPEWVCDSINLVPTLPRNSYGKLVRAELSGIAREHIGPVWRPAGGAPASEWAGE